jgi:hypothetical protein
MIRLFRKYHRALALIVFIPLILTVLTGTGYIIFDEWLGNEALGDTMLQIHTMEILGLGGFYPLLNALGLLGMLITGLSMTGLFRQQRSSLEK